MDSLEPISSLLTVISYCLWKSLNKVKHSSKPKHWKLKCVIFECLTFCNGFFHNAYQLSRLFHCNPRLSKKLSKSFSTEQWPIRYDINANHANISIILKNLTSKDGRMLNLSKYLERSSKISADEPIQKYYLKTEEC